MGDVDDTEKHLCLLLFTRGVRSQQIPPGKNDNPRAEQKAQRKHGVRGISSWLRNIHIMRAHLLLVSSCSTLVPHLDQCFVKFSCGVAPLPSFTVRLPPPAYITNAWD